LLCSTALATISGLVKNFSTEWNQHLLLFVTVVITYGLTILFTRWEKLTLKKAGVVPNRATWKKVAVGFAAGILMTALQPAIVLLLGHYKMSLNFSVSTYEILFYLTLYFLFAFIK